MPRMEMNGDAYTKKIGLLGKTLIGLVVARRHGPPEWHDFMAKDNATL